MKSLTYVEIDVDFCALTYGHSPCTAAIGLNGAAAKCFNSLKTCQDRANFSNSPVTLRFAMPTAYLPTDIDCIPSIKGVSFTPAVLAPGVNFGQRASVAVSFTDHPHPDTGPGFDKYVTERGYDPFAQGSFFGKFRARQPYLRGRPFRLIRGEVGDVLADMETRHYLIDSFTGPNTDGTYTLIAKDVLKLADDDRTQAPALSNGTLAADLTAIATTFSLSPTGIGATEYPASGYVCLGGKEVVSFTRAADAMTIARAKFNTTAQAFHSGDRVQLCLQYSSVDPAAILYDLLVTYAGVDASFIDLTAWEAETAAYLQRVYTALIVEPTGVNKLGSELIEQAGLNVWWDDLGQALRLQVLRAIPATADSFDENNTLQGTLQIREQPDKRASEIWIYFGLRNPCEPIDRTDNYQSILLEVDEQATSDYGSAAIKRIYSRWIPQFGTSIASRLGQLQLGRYRDPPRAFSFGVLRGTASPELGAGYQMSSWALQDETGAAAEVPIQVTQLDPGADIIAVQAEEALFTEYDDSFLFDRVITLDADTDDFNLRDVHDSLFPEIVASDLGSPGVTLTCIIAADVKVGASSTAVPAFDVGNWSVLPPITVRVLGRIQGCGGKGGDGSPFTAPSTWGEPTSGSPGGAALYTRVAITLEDTLGEVWGGGGGGAGNKGVSGTTPNSGGDGGAGTEPGAGGAAGTGAPGFGTDGHAGTSEAGGTFGVGGDGGDPGQAGGVGSNPNLAVGGAAGKAVDGVSHVTRSGATGDERGGTVN